MDVKSKFEKFGISLVQLFDREIVLSKESNIYTNDLDNAYPNRIEVTERNSKTANACSNKLGQFIFGKGFTITKKTLKTKGGKEINLNDCLQMAINSLKTHKGVYIHLNFDIENEVNYFDVLDFKKCRISKTDDIGYHGTVIYKDWIKRTSIFDFSKEEYVYFYPFNRKNINVQRIKDCEKNPKDIESLVKNYRGQVFFLTLEPNNVYPYAWLNGQAVYDADSEFRLALYRNSSIRKGFQDKTMFILNGLDKKTAENFQTNTKKWLGAENSGSVFCFETPEFLDNAEKLIIPIQLKSAYDSKKFEIDELAFEDSIRKCYLCIPEILIKDVGGAKLGGSGNELNETIKSFSNETAFLREFLENGFKQIFNFENKIIPLVESTDKDETIILKQKAVAELNGSVGGIATLVQIIKDVNNDLITLDSAIEIIKTMYQIEEKQVRKMFGVVKV